MSDNPLRIILNTTPVVTPSVPLQPLPKKMQPLPSTIPASTVPPTTQSFPAAVAPNDSDVAKRRMVVEQELQKLSEEENSLLSTLKDWMSKIQGVETQQQALERELFDLDRKIQAGPSPEQLMAERATQRQSLQKLVRDAEGKLNEITKQQKIDEKKAFDNYAAGGIDRQGLMDEMEHISQRYADAMAESKQAINDIQQQMEALEQAPIEAAPVQSRVAAPTRVAPPAPQPVDMPTPASEPATTPAATPITSGLGSKLTQLPGFSVNSITSIERSADATGVIINQQLFIADADLLRVNATAEDIIPLPVSTKTAKDVRSFTVPV